ncbi:MAG: hypothetical protein GY796_03490 [Chloroflexi bacterium]|nr:hypothetical protein [Chloroflexota bacterium]
MSKEQQAQQKQNKPQRPLSTPETLATAELTLAETGLQNPGQMMGLPNHPTSRSIRQATVLRMQQRQGNAAVQRYLSRPVFPRQTARPQLAAPESSFIQKFDPRYHRQSLVEGMVGSGFSAEEIGQMYAANWERDFSQAHPALGAIVLAWKRVKMAASKSRLTEREINAFEGSISSLVDMVPFRVGELLNEEAYGGYRYFEHMDNPTADMSGEARESMLRIPEGEVIPQYMVDSREYIKAQLFRAAQSYRGDMSEQGGAGQTAAAFNRRAQEVAGQIPPGQVAGGSVPAAAVAEETAEQVRQTPFTQITFPDDQITVPAPGGANRGGTNGALPTSGPAFNAEVDRRFWAKTQYKVGQRLDPNLAEDKPYVKIWLQIRNKVRAERQQAQPMQMPPQVVTGRRPLNPAGRWNQNVADAMGRASHALEDFFAHSNFVEIAIGEVEPSATLATGTFDAVDKKHALAHKIRSVADEIEAEMPLVNRVAGRTTQNPDPSQVNVGNAAPPTEEHDEPRSWMGALGGTGLRAIGTILGHAAGGSLAGGIVGGLPGAIFGGIMGLRSGIKSAVRNVIATPAGVQMLRRVSEMLEEQSREEAQPGSHTAMAKDQPGHEDNAFGRLRTIKFQLAQELAAAADRQILAAMRQVFDIGSPESADASLQDIYRTLDQLIAPPGGSHPLNPMIERRRQEAERALQEHKNSQQP